MSISNILKTIDVPVWGKSFSRTEDQFLTSGYQMIGGSSVSNFESDATTPQEIMIACKAKRRRITGYLSEGIKLNATSEWEPIINTTGISQLNKGIGTLNTLGQLGFAGETSDGGHSAGSVIQQPWLDRKFWKHTAPFTLNYNFNLVSEESSLNDVVLPAIALLSFCYPRKVNNVKGVNTLKEGLGEFTSETANTKGGKNVLNAINEALQCYAIPGPSLRYGAQDKSGDNGDAVTIVIGNMFAFGACYLKSVNLEFSPNFDYAGYPTWCKCSIQAEAMDSNYCEENGDFNVSQFANNANNISDLVDSLNTTVEDAFKNIANIAKATMNAIGAFPQTIQG